MGGNLNRVFRGELWTRRLAPRFCAAGAAILLTIAIATCGMPPDSDGPGADLPQNNDGTPANAIERVAPSGLSVDDATAAPVATIIPHILSESTAVPSTEAPRVPSVDDSVTSQCIADWLIYTSDVYGVSVRYPPDWRPLPNYQHRLGGADGFLEVSAVAGADLTIDEVANAEGFHRMRPYGSQPGVYRLTVDGQEARLILPSDDQPAEMIGQAALVVQAPRPVQIGQTTYSYILVWANQEHILTIGQNLAFNGVAPR